MSFSEHTKSELCTVESSEEIQKKAEIIGFLKAKGSFRISSDLTSVTLELPSISVARRLLGLLKEVASVDHKTVVVKTKRLQKRSKVEIDLSVSILDFLDISIVDLDADDIFDWISSDPVCFGSFLRGFFLASGSMIDPVKGYHLELISYSQDLLKSVAKALDSRFGISSQITKLRYYYRLSVRKYQELIEVLHLMGAPLSAKKVEDIVQRRLIVSDVNRSMNFLSANADRIGVSTAKQIRAIQVIDEKIGLDSLEDELRLLAELRLQNEDLSLRELGEMMNPPMSKSMVYSRIRKLIETAESLEERGKN